MSLRQAINAKCRDCIHDPGSGLGTWREQIAQCTCTACPLWPHRPGPESGPCTRSKMDAALCGRADSGRRDGSEQAGGTTPAEAA